MAALTTACRKPRVVENAKDETQIMFGASAEADMRTDSIALCQKTNPETWRQLSERIWHVFHLLFLLHAVLHGGIHNFVMAVVACCHEYKNCVGVTGPMSA